MPANALFANSGQPMLRIPEGEVLINGTCVRIRPALFPHLRTDPTTLSTPACSSPLAVADDIISSTLVCVCGYCPVVPYHCMLPHLVGRLLCCAQSSQ